MIRRHAALSMLLGWSVVLGCADGPREEADSPADTTNRAGTAPAADVADASGAAPTVEAGFPTASRDDPRVLIRDTHLRVTPSAVLHVSELLGQLVRLQEAPAHFNEPSSYAVRVERAVTTMTGPSLAALMNEYPTPCPTRGCS